MNYGIVSLIFAVCMFLFGIAIGRVTVTGTPVATFIFDLENRAAGVKFLAPCEDIAKQRTVLVNVVNVTVGPKTREKLGRNNSIPYNGS